MLTSCEVWYPTAGPPLSECSKAVIVAAWTPAAAGDCTPSEPHLKSPPTARWGYTHPAHQDKHTTDCEIFLTFFLTRRQACVHVRPVDSPGPGPAMRKPRVPYRPQRTVSSHWCSMSKMWWNPCGGQRHQNVATTDTEREHLISRQLTLPPPPPNISTVFPTCLFRPGSGDTSWKTATRPDAVPTATRSSKHLSSFTAVMASLLPWKHTRVTTGFETEGWWLLVSLFFMVYLLIRVIGFFLHIHNERFKTKSRGRIFQGYLYIFLFSLNRFIAFIRWQQCLANLSEQKSKQHKKPQSSDL